MPFPTAAALLPTPAIQVFRLFFARPPQNPPRRLLSPTPSTRKPPLPVGGAARACWLPPAGAGTRDGGRAPWPAGAAAARRCPRPGSSRSRTAALDRPGRRPRRPVMAAWTAGPPPQLRRPAHRPLPQHLPRLVLLPTNRCDAPQPASAPASRTQAPTPVPHSPRRSRTRRHCASRPTPAVTGRVRATRTRPRHA
jgi:hypothetical protein